MSQAKDVLNQIENHYGKDAYINRCDLSNHLRNDKIDNFVLACHKYDGFNSPMNYDDAIPLVMYYEDNSVLVVTIDRIFTAQEEA